MNTLDFPAIAKEFHGASREMLAAVLDQSLDCIKVIGPDGTLEFMNRNGRCAMEIDDFAAVSGRAWWELWPEETAPLIRDAFARAQSGESSRFEAFCPTAKGSPRWWDVSVTPLYDGDGTLRGLVSVSRDISEMMRAQEFRAATADEMRHRLQNAYTLVGAILIAAAKDRPERREFADEMLDRLQRLGIAQALLLGPAGMGETRLDLLVRRLTEPFCSGLCELHIGSLPDAILDEQQARTLALVIGELCTNSNKYGALGSGGSITIDGEQTDGRIRLLWRERTSAKIDSTERDGSSGYTLMRRALAALGGTIAVDWTEHGLDVTLTFRAPGASAPTLGSDRSRKELRVAHNSAAPT